jgi:hypothetical protein
MYFNNSDKEQQSSVSSPHTPTADINDFSFKDLEEGDLYCPIINEDDVEDPVFRKTDSKLPYIIIGKKTGHSTISYTDNPELPFSRREMRLCDKLSGNKPLQKHCSDEFHGSLVNNYDEIPFFEEDNIDSQNSSNSAPEVFRDIKKQCQFCYYFGGDVFTLCNRKLQVKAA